MMSSNSDHDSVAVRRQWILGLLAVLMVTCFSGCNYLVFFGYLLGGPPQFEPVFEKETGKSFTDHGVRIAVVVYADEKLTFNYSNVDYLLGVGISARLRQSNVDVISQDRIRHWLEENEDWDTPDEVGVDLGATHVLYVDMSNFSLYEHDTRHLFRGRSEVIVSVYEIDSRSRGRKIFSQDLSSEYPRLTQRPASEISYESFRSEYLLRLSDEIGRMFYPYGSGDDVGSGT